MPTARQTISTAFAELMRSDSPAIRAKGELAKGLWDKSAQPGMTPAQLLALADALVDTVDALPGPVQDSASVRIAWMGERPSIPAKPGEVIPDYRAALRGVVTAGFYVGQADETDAYLNEGEKFYASAPEEQSWADWAWSKASELVSPVREGVAAAQQAAADLKAQAEQVAADAKAQVEEAINDVKELPEEVGNTLKSLKNAAIAIGVTGVLVLAISASAGRGRRR